MILVSFKDRRSEALSEERARISRFRMRGARLRNRIGMCDLATPGTAAQVFERALISSGLSQREVAARIGADAPRVSGYLRGRLKPSLRIAVRLRDVLGIDPAVWA